MADPLWLQRKYAELLYSSVELFHVVKPDPLLINFRCDICGDSKKDKYKARGYIYENKGQLKYKCHNCQEVMSFRRYLQSYHAALYEQYMVELISMVEPSKNIFEQPNPKKFDQPIDKIPIKRFEKFEPLKVLKKVSQLPETHPCKQYVVRRQIPSRFHYKLYYAKLFYHWVNYFIPNKFSDKALEHDSGRLVIPLIDKNGFCFGAVGRSLDPNTDIGRYITILFDEEKPKIFGADTVDFSRKVYILEGAIDSLFIENSLAMNGISGKLPEAVDYVYVLDNERRNKEVLSKYEALIDDDQPICIWPSHIAQKDINEMVLAGYQPSEIKDIIDSHTFQGMMARLEFNSWRKL